MQCEEFKFYIDISTLYQKNFSRKPENMYVSLWRLAMWTSHVMVLMIMYCLRQLTDVFLFLVYK